MKNFVRALILALIVLVMYNVIAFVVPFAMNATFWVSYGFGLGGFGLVAAAFYIAFGGKDANAKSRFYGFPIARIGAIYGIVQLVLGFSCMALAFVLPWWVATVLQVIAFGATVIGLVSADMVVEEVKKQDTTTKQNVTLMRALQSKVNMLDGQCTNPDAAKAVKNLAEELRYSDPVSNEAVAGIEYNLAVIIDDLQLAVINGDNNAILTLCRNATMTLGERARICKLSK